MRLFFILFLMIAVVSAQDDLFTGVKKKPVTGEIQAFLTQIKSAIEANDENKIFLLSHISRNRFTGFVGAIFRLQISTLVEGTKVKSIEIVEGVEESQKSGTYRGVSLELNLKATHTVKVNLTLPDGSSGTLDFPAASEVPAREEMDQRNRWRIAALVPVEKGSLPTLEASRKRSEENPTQFGPQLEYAQLCALLGLREEYEKVELRLMDFANAQGIPTLFSQMGWMRLTLKDTQKALELFKKGFEAANGRSAQTEMEYAVGLYANGEKKKALEHYDSAAGKIPALLSKKGIEKQFAYFSQTQLSAIIELFELWEGVISQKPPNRTMGIGVFGNAIPGIEIGEGE